MSEFEELRDGDLRLELLENSLHPVHQVQTYFLRMVHAENGVEVGTINLRDAHNEYIERYAGHLGYSVREEHRGHRYAARALKLLLPLAAKLGINPLWVTCDPENIASRKTLECVGARFVEIVQVPEDTAIFQSGHRTKCRYRLDVSAV